MALVDEDVADFVAEECRGDVGGGLWVEAVAEGFLCVERLRDRRECRVSAADAFAQHAREPLVGAGALAGHVDDIAAALPYLAGGARGKAQRLARVQSEDSMDTQTMTTTNTTATDARYPRMIDNGEGERLTFLGVRTDADGRQVLEVETRCSRAAVRRCTLTSSRKRA